MHRKKLKNVLEQIGEVGKTRKVEIVKLVRENGKRMLRRRRKKENHESDARE